MTRPRRMLLLISLLVLTAALPAFGQPLHLPLEAAGQDQAFSEFNHHLAGWFLLAIGILAFAGALSPGRSPAEKIWPFLFMLPGLYLAFMSDPDVWPMGRQSWIQAFTGNPEAAQHKTFALLLISLGLVEFQRSRGRLPQALAVWSFPVLALFGAVLLFFHPHPGAGAGMPPAMPGMHHGGHAMTESMLTVQREHFWFSVTGFCVMICKFLADSRFWKRAFVPFLWPSFIAVLGVLLILYKE